MAIQGQILSSWTGGKTPTSAEWQQLSADALADERRAKAFGITPANVSRVIQAKWHIFSSVYPNITQLKAAQAIPELLLLETLWNLWIPLATQLAAARRHLERPLIQGILGGQGTGKTTLGAVLSLILGQMGNSTLSLSLDDLYKTYAERQCLREQDPRLVWRGPPGTHDLQLGLQVLDQLRQPDKQPIQVPRFDKSAWGGAGDRSQPEVVEGVDIVLFEGWFVGARPLDSAVFETAPPPILTPADRVFARDMNTQLKDYLPLWERLDRLMVLYPTDWRLSLLWRTQAEHQMIAAQKVGMTDPEIAEFVNYFWKSLHPELFVQPLTKDPKWVDLVIEINPDHSVSTVYRPGDS